MDPYFQAALIAVVGALICGVAARIFVPMLPPSPLDDDRESPPAAAE